jgi:membrane-associated phospholipid phosphatase
MVLDINGKYAPTILFLTSIYLLWDKNTALFYYTFGFFINMLLNLGVKGVLKEPRPDIDETNFKLLLTHGQRFIIKNGLPYDIFGMPSGHTQSCFFSTIYIYLTIQNYRMLLIYLLLCLSTIYQRIAYNHHTLLQVIMGGTVGAFFGYITFYLYSQSLKGKIDERSDDYASN